MAVFGVGVGLGAGGCGVDGGLSDGWEVDRIEEGTAVLVRTGAETKEVPRRALPAGVREGDLLREGKVDEAQRRLLAERVRLARERADTRAGSFDLTDGADGLTLRGQR